MNRRSGSTIVQSGPLVTGQVGVMAPVDRRRFLRSLAGGAVLAACSDSSGPRGSARLTARPTGSSRTLAAGTTRTRSSGTEIVAYMPQSAMTRLRIPLFVFLHGADRQVELFVDTFSVFAEESGVMVLAPYAESGTWDVLNTGSGPDVRGIDHALTWAFGVAPVDAAHVVLSGFSDGASYTLNLGRTNGDLFYRLVAFSPGFLLDVAEAGKPSIAISHGTQDAVIPFQNTRDVIVPALRARGYSVEFTSFVGPHAVLGALARAEFQRMAVSD